MANALQSEDFTFSQSILGQVSQRITFAVTLGTKYL